MRNLVLIIFVPVLLGCSSKSENNFIEAVDDYVSSVQNFERTFEKLLFNDSFDGSIILNVDGTSQEGGKVEVNNRHVVYTPATDFIGVDHFEYQLCASSDQSNCSVSNVQINVLPPTPFILPQEIQGYYGNLTLCTDKDTNQQVLSELTQKSHSNILTYTERHNFLYTADADLIDSENVILIYSGETRYWEEYTSPNNSYNPQTFNTEHVYPQSKLNDNDAVTDLHHLRVCDDQINSDKSNFSFTDGSGEYGVKSQRWYPGDEWKGDVARMIFYLSIRYKESINVVGSEALFIKWNIEDPVSDFERQRNNAIQQAQGNRNPFIDNPYLVTLVWGGEDAENLWE